MSAKERLYGGYRIALCCIRVTVALAGWRPLAVIGQLYGFGVRGQYRYYAGDAELTWVLSGQRIPIHFRFPTVNAGNRQPMRASSGMILHLQAGDEKPEETNETHNCNYKTLQTG